MLTVSKEDAADDAVEPGRLLPGEDPSSRRVDDAEHWIGVYEELLSFKSTLLRETEARLAEMTEPVRAEIMDTDYVIMRSERARFQRRLDFWTRRLADVSRE